MGDLATIDAQQKQLEQSLKAASNKIDLYKQQMDEKEAELRQKEKAVTQHRKQERARQVEAEYESLAEPEKPRKPARKPARRVIVTEVSSESESEHSDVEVVLPRARPPPQASAEELLYQRKMERMFTLGV